MLKLIQNVRQLKFEYTMEVPTSTMAAKSRHALFTIILLYLLRPCTDTAEECGIRDQSVFENQIVTFTIRSEIKPDFTINGQDQYSTDQNLQRSINYNTNGDCHSLTFLAGPGLDGAAKIAFSINGTSVGMAELRIQGVLGKPSNFSLERLNSTHGVISWDGPPSLVEPSSASYLLNINEMQVSTNSNSYKFQWPLPLNGYNITIKISITACNPVGKGGTSSIVEHLQCDGLNDLIPKISPYYHHGDDVWVSVEFLLDENGMYCCPQQNVTLLHQTSDSTFTLHWKSGTANFVIENISRPKHMNDTFDICLEHFHITYSTYKVQRVNVSGDREKMLQCYFIQGATDKQCFVEVYRNGKFEEPYSDFDKYKIRIPEPGNYTIKVYDNKEQADQGIQPANETSFIISEENNKRQDTSFIVLLVGSLGGIILLLVIVYVIRVPVVAIIEYYRNKPTKAETKPPDIDVISANPVMTPADKEEGAMETGIERRDVATRRQQPPPTYATHRDQEIAPQEEAIEMNAITSSRFNAESHPIRENEDKEECVVEGLENTTISGNPPEEQTVFDENSTAMA